MVCVIEGSLFHLTACAHTHTHPHSDPEYQDYRKSVSPLIPWIPPLYRHTPYPLKLIFCCEFPFYSCECKSDAKTMETQQGREDKDFSVEKGSETIPIATDSSYTTSYDHP